jgi:hypothetical protein
VLRGIPRSFSPSSDFPRNALGVLCRAAPTPLAKTVGVAATKAVNPRFFEKISFFLSSGEEIEGPVVAPLSFGDFAGQILVADEGEIDAINTDGPPATVTHNILNWPSFFLDISRISGSPLC